MTMAPPAGATSAATVAQRRPGAPGRHNGLALISPAVLYAVLLLAAPIAVVIAHSFWTQTYLTIDHTPTLDNYRVALTDPMYRDLLARSIGISVLVSIVTVLLAYPIAYYISFRGGRYKSLIIFLITIPFWTSYLLRVMAWKVVLGQSGALNSTLMWLGIIDEPSTAFLYNTSAVVITLTHAWAAFAILPIFVSLERVDRSLLEAARDLGDGPIRAFLRVTLPLTIPGIVGALIIVLIPTVGDYVTPRLVGGTSGQMISNAIEAQFGRASNWPLGAALSVVTMAAVTLVAGALVLVLRSVPRWVK